MSIPPKGITPTEADVGRAVVYRSAPAYDPEQGIVTSFRKTDSGALIVFVRYGSKVNSEATCAEDLDWAFS